MTAKRILILFFVLVLFPWAGSLEASQVFRMNDPQGDDFGAGDLVYPNRPDFEPGSLDLEYLSARTGDGGTWFRARMGRPIQSPVGRVGNVGAEPLHTLARNGFYTFNIDIYIDTDRIAGSGRTDTLPGRLVNVHRDTAWEKAVILTPRPQVARAWYTMHLVDVYEAELRAERGRVDREDLAAIEARVEEDIARQFFFPDRVRVRGREIDFFVPDAFLGGPASKDWAYTVLVTGADIEQAGRVLNISPGAFSLMAMQLAPGRATDRFGIVNRGDINQPPVIDVLAPTIEAQRNALRDYDAVAPRLAAIQGVSPAGRASVASSAVPTPAPGTAPAPAGPPSTVTPSTPQAAQPPAAAPSMGPAGTPPPGARRSVPERLRTLNTLREEGLITETEYQQLRRRILSEL
jgi:hypothetical protein